MTDKWWRRWAIVLLAALIVVTAAMFWQLRDDVKRDDRARTREQTTACLAALQTVEHQDPKLVKGLPPARLVNIACPEGNASDNVLTIITRLEQVQR